VRRQEVSEETGSQRGDRKSERSLTVVLSMCLLADGYIGLFIVVYCCFLLFNVLHKRDNNQNNDQWSVMFQKTTTRGRRCSTRL